MAGEALAVGAVGTLLGIGLGLALAQGLLGLVTRTINDLYFVLSVREVWLTPGAVVKAVALGMGATLLAALAPAREAAATRPREALLRSLLEARARRTAPRAALAGLALGAVGGLLLLPRGGAVWGFVGLFALLMGAALATPLAASAMLRVLEWPARRIGGLLGGMAARGIHAALSRTGIAIAALMIAVSATIGVGIMIASFREAVERWLEGTLRADVYVSPPSLIGSRPDATLDAGLAERLAATPGVAGVSTSRGATAASPRGPVHVVALGVAAGRAPSFPMKEGRLERVWAAVESGAVMVSEPFAYRRALDRGPPGASQHRPRPARLPHRGRLLRLRLERGRGGDEPRHLRALLGRPRGVGDRALRGPGRRSRCAHRRAAGARGGGHAARRKWSSAPIARCARRRWRSSTAPSR